MWRVTRVVLTTRTFLDQSSAKVQRVAPPGSTVPSAVAARGVRRYTNHGGGPAEGSAVLGGQGDAAVIDAARPSLGGPTLCHRL